MENLNNWHLPFDARPGTDITTKLILSNKTVINTVVQNLLGRYVFLPKKYNLTYLFS
jgi:hypothetical protein